MHSAVKVISDSNEQALAVSQKGLAEATSALKIQEKNTGEIASRLQRQDFEMKELRTALDAAKQREKEMVSQLSELKKREKNLLETVDDQLAVTASVKNEARETIEVKRKAIGDLEVTLKECQQRLEISLADKKAVETEKGEAEEKICQLQSLREKERETLEEKITDLERAKELLLDSKVIIQDQLEEMNSKLSMQEAQTKTVRAEAVKKEKDLREEMGQMRNVIVSLNFSLSLLQLYLRSHV